ncbi:hypothetical protein [Streptomyces coeruleorubidus]|uniref:hypothetical protein n=1 Tax=Streptomyces coeruleorubidus TaxID=116188 RepID=UPI0036B40E08
MLLEALVAPLHRVFADPDDVADVAEGLVHHWRTPHGEYGREWDPASELRTAIEKFRQLRGS